MISILGPNIKKLKKEGDINGLMSLLTHKKVFIREKASATLSDIGNEGVPYLLKVILSPSPLSIHFRTGPIDPKRYLREMKQEKEEKKKKKLQREMAIATLHKMGPSCLPIISEKFAQTESLVLLNILESKGWAPESKKEKIAYFRLKGGINELVKIVDEPEKEIARELNRTGKFVRECLPLLSELKTEASFKVIKEYYTGNRVHWQRLATLKILPEFREFNGYLDFLITLLRATAISFRKSKEKHKDQVREEKEILDILKGYLLQENGTSLKRYSSQLIPLLNDPELNAVIMISLAKMGGAKPIDALIQHLYKDYQWKPNLDSVQIKKYFQTRFKDYLKLIFNSSHVPGRVTDAKKWHNADVEINLGYTQHYVEQICEVNSPVSSNLLNLIKSAQDPRMNTSGDITVLGHSGGRTYQDKGSTRLSLKSIRKMAAQELEKRENPPYDPAHYAKRSAFTIA